MPFQFLPSLHVEIDNKILLIGIYTFLKHCSKTAKCIKYTLINVCIKLTREVQLSVVRVTGKDQWITGLSLSGSIRSAQCSTHSRYSSGYNSLSSTLTMNKDPSSSLMSYNADAFGFKSELQQPHNCERGRATCNLYYFHRTAV